MVGGGAEWWGGVGCNSISWTCTHGRNTCVDVHDYLFSFFYSHAENWLYVFIFGYTYRGEWRWFVLVLWGLRLKCLPIAMSFYCFGLWTVGPARITEHAPGKHAAEVFCSLGSQSTSYFWKISLWSHFQKHFWQPLIQKTCELPVIWTCPILAEMQITRRHE